MKKLIEEKIKKITKDLEIPEETINSVINGNNIDGYIMGKRLTNREVSQLKIGEIVWLRYKEDNDWRIDGAEKVLNISDETIAFASGDFIFPKEINDESYVDFEYGFGVIHKAVEYENDNAGRKIVDANDMFDLLVQKIKESEK